jgi:predicted nucleic acid-binding protein
VFLLDTNIVSELRGTRPHGAVVAWIESVPATDLRLAAVTLGEIQRGVEIHVNATRPGRAKSKPGPTRLKGLFPFFPWIPQCFDCTRA